MATIDQLKRPYLARLKERQVQQVDTQSQEEVYIPSEAEVQAQQDYENQLATYNANQEALRLAEKVYYSKDSRAIFALADNPLARKYYREIKEAREGKEEIEKIRSELALGKDLSFSEVKNIANQTYKALNENYEAERKRLEAEIYQGQSVPSAGGYVFTKSEVPQSVDLKKKYNVIDYLKQKSEEQNQLKQAQLNKIQTDLTTKPKVYSSNPTEYAIFNKPSILYQVTLGMPETVARTIKYFSTPGQLQREATKEQEMFKSNPLLYGIARGSAEVTQNLIGYQFGAMALGSVGSGGGFYKDTLYLQSNTPTRFIGTLKGDILRVESKTGDVQSFTKTKVTSNNALGKQLTVTKNQIVYSDVFANNKVLGEAKKITPIKNNPLIRSVKNKLQDVQTFFSRGFSIDRKTATKTPQGPKIETLKDQKLKNSYLAGYSYKINEIPKKFGGPELRGVVKEPIKEDLYFVSAGSPKMRIYKDGRVTYTIDESVQGIIRVGNREGKTTDEVQRLVLKNVQGSGLIQSVKAETKEAQFNKKISQILEKTPQVKTNIAVVPLLQSDKKQIFIDGNIEKDKNIFIPIDNQGQADITEPIQDKSFKPFGDILEGQDFIKGNRDITEPIQDKGQIRDQITQRASTVGKLQEKKTIKTSIMQNFNVGIPLLPPEKPRQPPRTPKFDLDRGQAVRKQQAIERFENAYSVFIKRQGKDSEVFKTKNIEEAKDYLKSRLSRTLARSGYITSGGSKEKIDLGMQFRPGKKDPFRVVQKAKFSLSAPSEVREIQMFKKRKKKKGFSLW